LSDETKEKKPRRPNLTEGEKAQLLLMVGQGHKKGDIARHFQITERGVYRYISELKKMAALPDVKTGEAAADIPNPKQVVIQKAYPALHDGLDCTTDPYKRGNLAIRALQGVGEFQPDNQVNINTLIQNMPPEYRERYLVTTED